MNLELLNTFGQNYPEDYDGSLDYMGVSLTCQFSRRGTMLAVGTNDGKIIIWDFLTRGISKVINAHVWPVCSLSWSRNGHKLLSASTDDTVCVWEVLTGECLQCYRFPSPILKVQFHPRNDNLLLVCPMRHAPLLVNCSTGTHSTVPLENDQDLNLTASFDRRGIYILSGNGKGKIYICKTCDLSLVTTVRVTGTSATGSIKQIEFARRGSSLLVNAADRIIRLFELPDLLNCEKGADVEPRQKLQDLVNKTLWRKCCFSGDGEYICASSTKQHNIYIWEKSNGNLVQILTGTKGETLLDLVWHPVRPVIASIASGTTSIWSQNQVENWSAFAPDFRELDENVEYDERESEFDVYDEDKDPVPEVEHDDEEIIVDVDTVQTIQAFLSSDEEENDANQLLFIPVAPEIDEPDEVMADSDEQASEFNPDDSSKNTQCKAKETFDIDLPSAPVNEVHPLLISRRSTSERQGSRRTTGSARSKGRSTASNRKNRRAHPYSGSLL